MSRHSQSAKNGVYTVLLVCIYDTQHVTHGIKLTPNPTHPIRSVIQIVDDHMLIFDPKKEDEDVFFHRGVRQRRDITKRQHRDQKFVFEKVFAPDSTNQDIFLNTTKDMLDTLLQGYNCSGELAAQASSTICVT